MNHWFLGKGQGPLRDGRPSFEEELAKMPPMADSCYRGPAPCPHRALLDVLNAVSAELAPRTPEPAEPSLD